MSKDREKNAPSTLAGILIDCLGVVIFAGGVAVGRGAGTTALIVLANILQAAGLATILWGSVRYARAKGYDGGCGLLVAPLLYAWLLCKLFPDVSTYTFAIVGLPGLLGFAALVGLPDRRGRSLSIRQIVWQTLAFEALVVGSAISLIPFLWMLGTSFKDAANVFADPPQIIPRPWLWSNYAQAFSKLPFARYTFNTCLITAISMLGQLTSCSLVAFGFARMRFPGRNVLFVVLLSTMMLPAQVTMIPVFKVFSTLGWYDTFLPLTVPSFFGSAFFIFLLRQYYMTVPHEMDEAARIDGASTWQVFSRVLLPQIKPALATVAIFSFMNNWNDFMGPLIYISTPAKRTLALGLYAFQGQYATDYNYLMAASAVVMLPLLVLFFAGQRYFIQGVVISGVKG